MSLERFNPEYWMDLIREEIDRYEVSRYIVMMPGSASFHDEVYTPLGFVSLDHGAYFNFMVNSIDDLQEDREKAKVAVKTVSERLAIDTEQYLLSELGLESISELSEGRKVIFYISKILAYPAQFFYGIKGLVLCGIIKE